MIRPECYGIKVIALVEHEDIERVVFSWIGKGYARGSYGIWKPHVKNEVGIVGVGSLADVGSAQAQDMVVFQHPPVERSWGLVVFSMVDVGSGC